MTWVATQVQDKYLKGALHEVFSCHVLRCAISEDWGCHQGIWSGKERYVNCFLLALSFTVFWQL